MEVTLTGMVTEVISVQVENVLFRIAVMPSGMTTEVTLLSAKADAAIIVTLSGMM